MKQKKPDSPAPKRHYKKKTAARRKELADARRAKKRAVQKPDPPNKTRKHPVYDFKDGDLVKLDMKKIESRKNDRIYNPALVDWIHRNKDKVFMIFFDSRFGRNKTICRFLGVHTWYFPCSQLRHYIPKRKTAEKVRNEIIEDLKRGDAYE